MSAKTTPTRNPLRDLARTLARIDADERERASDIRVAELVAGEGSADADERLANANEQRARDLDTLRAAARAVIFEDGCPQCGAEAAEECRPYCTALDVLTGDVN